MKKIYLYLSFVILFLMGLQFNSAWAQGRVRVTLINPPMNQLSVEHVWKMTLENLTDSTLNLYLVGSVEKDNEKVVDGTSAAIMLPPGKSNYNYRSFETGSVNWYDNDLKEFVLRTATVPAGNYETCIQAFSSENNIPLSTQTCINIPIVRGQTAEITLISPADGESLEYGNDVVVIWPRFTWSSPVSKGPYNIVIKEMKEGQSREQAMNENKVIFNKKNIQTTSYQYGAADPKIEEGKDYVWRVGSKDVWSEIWLFKPRPFPGRKFSCKDFKVTIVKNDTCKGCKDTCCYNISIINNYNGLKIYRPKSFRVITNNASIITAAGVPTGWSQSPSIIPTNSKNLIWKKTLGYISTGTTKLAKICFGNVTTDPFYVVYEWVGRKGKILCRDSVKVICKDSVKLQPICGKFAIALYNGVSPIQFSKVRITPTSGSKMINSMIGIEDEDVGTSGWNQTIGSNYSYVEWSYIGSTIPYDVASYMDEEMYIWMDPTINSNQEVVVDWYDVANTIVATQKLFLPSLGDPSVIYSDTYDWEANTTQVAGVSLSVFAGAAPEDCEQDEEDSRSACNNQINHSISCVNNVLTLTFSCNPLEDDQSGLNWYLYPPNSSTPINDPPNNKYPLTQSGNYTLALSIHHKPANGVTPPDCDYQEPDITVSIPEPVISEAKITPVDADTGDCNFKVELDATNSNYVSGLPSSAYDWVITGTGSTTYNKIVSNQESISLVIIDQGTYSAKLTITDSYGCTYSVTKAFTLTFLCDPKFEWGTYEWCKDSATVPPAKDITIKFTNTSQGGKCPITYKWDFGDGSTPITDPNPVDPIHTFTSVPGTGKTYTVKLTMFDLSNCKTPNGKTFTKQIRIEPYYVNFTMIICKTGQVNFSTTNDNPIWAFPGSENTISWVTQYVLGLFGYYNNPDPVIKYSTGGPYTASLKATSNTTHASCTVRKTFYVDQLCCDKLIKSPSLLNWQFGEKKYKTIGNKDYRMWVFYKWKTERWFFRDTKVKVSNRVAKKFSKKWNWYRRIHVQHIYAGIGGIDGYDGTGTVPGTYYTKDHSNPNAVCECEVPNQVWYLGVTKSVRGRSVYRTGINETRYLRPQSMKALFGIYVANQGWWHEWVDFEPCGN